MGSEHDKSKKMCDFVGSKMGRGLVQHHEISCVNNLDPYPLSYCWTAVFSLHHPGAVSEVIRTWQIVHLVAAEALWVVHPEISLGSPWLKGWNLNGYPNEFAQIPTSHLPSCSVFVLRCSTLLLTTHSTPQIDLFVLCTDWYLITSGKKNNCWKIDRSVGQMLRSECRPKQRSI